MTTYNEKPDIMAIGDSIYQGIRSLSFLPSMVEHSVPKQVANALGMAMTVPDLQQPLLYDLEAEMRRGGLIDFVRHIRGICIENLKAWPLDQPWSKHEAFDNIAVGGAEIASLMDDTYDKYIDQVQDLSAKLKSPDLTLEDIAKTVGGLWFALNNCYTLNPRHRNDQRGKSQLDQVEERQPRILLINIGSNEGLFGAGFGGDFSDKTMARVDSIPDLLKPVAQRLKALPQRVERIVFNGLIRPRFIPNLMPHPDHENDFPSDNYHFAYGSRISSSQQSISNAKLKAFDELVADVNARSQSMLADMLGSRVAFVDIYAACSEFDGKHYAHRGVEIPGIGRTLNNKPITPFLGGYFGGFTGMDNMHPTVPGYAVIADAVLAALGRDSLRTDKDAAYAADTLLNNVGLSLLFWQMKLSALGEFGVFRGTDDLPAPERVSV